MYLYDNSLLKSVWAEECFKQSLRDNQSTFYLQ